MLYMWVRVFLSFFFFFFKQKTAYEIRLSLVGSEMCIRDRCRGRGRPAPRPNQPGAGHSGGHGPSPPCVGWPGSSVRRGPGRRGSRRPSVLLLLPLESAQIDHDHDQDEQDVEDAGRGGHANVLLCALERQLVHAVSYTHLTLPTIERCRSRWSPYH